MVSALITGITGQDGSYLAELLLQKGYTVYGLNRRKATAGMENLTGVIDNSNFRIIEGDLTEESRLFKIVRELELDEIYNMGAQSFVPYSWEVPLFTCDVNALGVIRLLEAIKVYSPKTKFLQASSSEIYGRVSESPQNELTYHYPQSPYGCSKSFAHNITRNYRESFNLFCCNSICFNHESERRGLQFVTRKITRTVAEIHFGSNKKLTLGNLDAKRDWGYAPDYVEAMWLMMQHSIPNDYVVSTGESYSIRQFVEFAFNSVDICIEWSKDKGVDSKGFNADTKEVLVESSPKFYRPVDVDTLNGDYTKISSDLGWKPKTTFRQMIEKMVNYDVDILKKRQKVSNYC